MPAMATIVDAYMAKLKALRDPSLDEGSYDRLVEELDDIWYGMSLAETREVNERLIGGE